MKINISFLVISMAILMTLNSCKNKNTITTTEPTSTYFGNTDSGVHAGGVKVIPITTPKGNFSFWTKRIRNNPSMKVLILQGGPGGTHKAYECFESFLPKEGTEFIYYDQLASGNSKNPQETSLYDLS